MTHPDPVDKYLVYQAVVAGLGILACLSVSWQGAQHARTGAAKPRRRLIAACLATFLLAALWLFIDAAFIGSS